MALARVVVFSSGTTIKSADVNGELNNILNNALSLISPLTGNLNFNSNQATNFVLEKLATAPAAATQGRLFYNTATTGGVQYDSGSAIFPLGRGIKSVQTFTSTGATWTKPAGVTRVLIEVVGAGGGSGGLSTTPAGNASISGGGGGGGYALKLLSLTSTMTTATIVAGAGGAGGAIGAAGSSGGTSSWSDGTNTISATGGAGSQGAGATAAPAFGTGAQSPAVGGTGSGGDINLTGGDGSLGIALDTATHFKPGRGGASVLSGEIERGSAVSAIGLAGRTPGGGATGSSIGALQPAVAGAAGAAGLVVVWEME